MLHICFHLYFFLNYSLDNATPFSISPFKLPHHTVHPHLSTSFKTLPLNKTTKKLPKIKSSESINSLAVPYNRGVSWQRSSLEGQRDDVDWAYGTLPSWNTTLDVQYHEHHTQRKGWGNFWKMTWGDFNRELSNTWQTAILCRIWTVSDLIGREIKTIHYEC